MNIVNDKFYKIFEDFGKNIKAYVLSFKGKKVKYSIDQKVAQDDETYDTIQEDYAFDVTNGGVTMENSNYMTTLDKKVYDLSDTSSIDTTTTYPSALALLEYVQKIGAGKKPISLMDTDVYDENEYGGFLYTTDESGAQILDTTTYYLKQPGTYYTSFTTLSQSTLYVSVTKIVENMKSISKTLMAGEKVTIIKGSNNTITERLTNNKKSIGLNRSVSCTATYFGVDYNGDDMGFGVEY